MRVMRNPKADDNQKQIVSALRKIGASVQILGKVGDGCPDLIVGYNRKTLLLEVKSEHGRLTYEQERWWSNWNGSIPVVVRTQEQAIWYVTHQI
jgi:hypothetical protein